MGKQMIQGPQSFFCSVYGAIEESDPQRTLALPNPVLPSGSAASGFVGYAVNMINLDTHLLDIKTKAGHGLRETLFYQLFGELQVYETREHMNKARACIMHGAVSLDGGILRASGIISLGYGDPEIRFPVEVLQDEIHLSPMLMEFKKMERELQEINRNIVKCSRSLEKSMKKYTKKKYRYSNFMDQVKPELK